MYRVAASAVVPLRRESPAYALGRASLIGGLACALATSVFASCGNSSYDTRLESSGSKATEARKLGQASPYDASREPNNEKERGSLGSESNPPPERCHLSCCSETTLEAQREAAQRAGGDVALEQECCICEGPDSSENSGI